MTIELLPPPKSEQRTATMAGQLKVFDLEGTLRRLSGDHTILADLVRIFREDAPGLVEWIATGIENHKAPDVHLAAHAMRGLAANFGAARLIAPLESLEAAAARGQLDDAPNLLATIRSELANLQQALDALE